VNITRVSIETSGAGLIWSKKTRRGVLSIREDLLSSGANTRSKSTEALKRSQRANYWHVGPFSEGLFILEGMTELTGRTEPGRDKIWRGWQAKMPGLQKGKANIICDSGGSTELCRSDTGDLIRPIDLMKITC